MLNKPIISFTNNTNTGIDVVPINSLVYIDDSDGVGNSRFIIVKDNTMMTSTSTIADFINYGSYKDISPYLGNAPAGMRVNQDEFISTDLQTVFTIPNDYINTETMVFINGIKLKDIDWSILSVNSISLNIKTRAKDVISIMTFSATPPPALPTVVLTAPTAVNMTDTFTITIDNYTPTYTYTSTWDNAPISITSNTITLSAPVVTADILKDFVIYASKVDYSDSPHTTASVNIIFIAYIDDQALVYDSVSMTEFTDLKNMNVTTTLNAGTIDKTNIITSASIDVFNTTTKILDGDILNVDGTDMVVSGVSGVSVVSSTNPFNDGSLIAKYEMEGNANDTLGLNNGTATSVTYGNGKFGQCTQYIAGWSPVGYSNSVTSGITIDSTILSSKTALSISMWVNSSDAVKPTIITGQPYTGQRLFNVFLIKSDATDYFYLGATPIANTIRLYSGGNNNLDNNMNSGVYSFPLNQWNHVVLVFNGSTTSWEVYINNSLVYTFINAAFTITGTSTVGDAQGLGCLPYTNVTSGDKYDQVEIYNRALTPAEVNILYTQSKYSVPTTSVTAGGIPTTAYINEHRAISNQVIQDAVDTNWHKIGTGTTPFEGKFEYTNISTSTIADTLITPEEIKDGDNLVIVKLDNSINQVVANGVISDILDGSLNNSVVTAVPIMTSDSTPAGICNSLNPVFSTHLAYTSFDGNVSDGVGWMVNNNNVYPQTLEYKFENPIIINKVIIYNRKDVSGDAYTTAIGSHIIQASNDGITWIDLSTTITNTSNIGGFEHQPITFINYSKYLYYRVYITSGLDAQYVGIGELKFIEAQVKTYSMDTSTITAGEIPSIVFKTDTSLSFIDTVNGVTDITKLTANYFYTNLIDSTNPFGEVTSSLVAKYQLDGNALDTLGLNNGISTGVTYSTGKFGQCGVFDGTTSMLNASSNLIQNFFTSSYTLSCFVNLPSSVVTLGINIAGDSRINPIICQSDYISGPGLQGFSMCINNGGLAIGLGKDVYAGDLLSTATGIIQANVWTHLLISKTSTNVFSFYINGVLYPSNLVYTSGSVYSSANTRALGIMSGTTETYGNI